MTTSPRILPVEPTADDSGVEQDIDPVILTALFGRMVRALERIADRLDADAAVFNEMVEKGKGLSV